MPLQKIVGNKNADYWSDFDSFNGDNGSLYGWKHSKGYSVDPLTNIVKNSHLRNLLEFKQICIKHNVSVAFNNKGLILLNDKFVYFPDTGEWTTDYAKKVYRSKNH